MVGDPMDFKGRRFEIASRYRGERLIELFWGNYNDCSAVMKNQLEVHKLKLYQAQTGLDTDMNYSRAH